MTEAEWRACGDPVRMLTAMGHGLSARRLRLFGVACCRLNSRIFLSPGFGRVLEVGELLADGLVHEDERMRVHAGARHPLHPDFRARESQRYLDCPADVVADAYTVSRAVRAAGLGRVSHARGAATLNPAHEAVESEEAAALRDIAGNPFRPVTFAPSWRSSTALAVAEGVYADRAFDRLPILADALEDAGCEDADLLGHLRGPGPHVRGCWAVDLVLGRS